jgi:hypothetical protein
MASIYERLNFSFDTGKFGDSINLSDSTKSYLKAAPVKLEDWQKNDLATGGIVKTDYFKNPMITVTSRLSDNVAVLNSVLQTIDTFDNGSGTELKTSVSNLIIEIRNYLSHTSNISGVTESKANISEGSIVVTHFPDYNKAVSAGEQILMLTSATDGVANTVPLLGNFTSLFISDEITSNANNIINNIVLVKNSIRTETTAGETPVTSTLSNLSLSIITSLTANVTSANTLLSTRRLHDWNFYRNSLNILDDYNKLNSLGRVGNTQKYLINNLIGTDKYKNSLADESVTDPLVSQYSDFWSKENTLTTIQSNSVGGVMDRNWGLYRSWYGSNPDITWGSSGTGATGNRSGTVSLKAGGKGVDVVIVDGVIDPNHPEFAVRPDGTGGSRVKYFNWYSLNIPGDASYGQTYSPPITTNASSSSDDSRHAVHVAGTVAGNTQGWARNANIYNISPQYVTGGVLYVNLYKYILYWHNQKRAAGNMTPTIVNNSWSSRYTITYTNITSVTYQGTTVAGPFTINQLASYGIYVDSSNIARIPLRNDTMDADIQACIDAGIIMVASAGNQYYRMTTNTSDVDYNNTVTATGSNSGNPIFYSRGSSPGSASNVICVGGISSSINSPGPDRKLDYSNRGPRVDVFAPGTTITSAWLTNIITDQGILPTPVIDARNSNYYVAKLSGTSMASPQVCGVLACALEITPTMNQAAALTYITQNAGINQIPTTTGGVTDPYDLLGAANLYLAVPPNLKSTG